MAVADLGAHLLDQRVGDVGGRPLGAEPGEVVQKPAEHLLPVWGVHHLRVILHPGQAPVEGLEGGHRGTGAASHHVESVRRGRDRVTVTHPYRLNLGKIRMQFATKDFQFSPTVFASAGVGDDPPSACAMA